ncbi:hypothetical protein APHAL10511_006686 [Amanita phalloides]|nr:hypothetical protein APHAL10511_006686 [Amanita phalloides]
MPTFFLFLFVLLTVGQALQQGSADNDTIILTNLEDIFGTGNLDKRRFRQFLNNLRPKKEAPPPPPVPRHGKISVPLKKDEIEYWYIEVPSHTSREFKFEIDTYGICSWVPHGIDFFWVGSPESNIHCPGRPFSGFSSFSGHARRSRITIGTVPWEGYLISEKGEHSHGILGWTLSDSTVPEEMHFLPGFLSKFESPIFAMYLTDLQGEAKLDIGGVDDRIVRIEYHKVVKTGHGHQPWLIGPVRIFVGNARIETNTGSVPNIEAAFDSTILYLRGPPSEVTEIKAKIRAEGTKDRVVYFQWGTGNKWSLKPDSSHSGSSDHWSSYENLIIPGHPKMVRWEVGTKFWFERYMIFKAGPVPEVGIAELPPPYERPPSRDGSFIYPPPQYGH